MSSFRLRTAIIVFSSRSESWRRYLRLMPLRVPVLRKVGIVDQGRYLAQVAHVGPLQTITADVLDVYAQNQDTLPRGGL